MQFNVIIYCNCTIFSSKCLLKKYMQLPKPPKSDSNDKSVTKCN